MALIGDEQRDRAACGQVGRAGDGERAVVAGRALGQLLERATREVIAQLEKSWAHGRAQIAVFRPETAQPLNTAEAYPTDSARRRTRAS